MKASDMEEIRHAINRLRAKASEGATMQTSTVMNETAIVMDAIYRAEREPIPAVSPPARRETWKEAAKVERPWVEDEAEILRRLASGDTIVFSQDGDMAWFTKGDRAFVGDAIMELRKKGFLLRKCDDDENYRGLSEYDTISETGRAALRATEERDDG